jgi:predicted ATPase/class 3 adenylate cyclase
MESLPPLSPEPLTRREREILGLLAENLTNQEIAERLTLALSSVKWYLQQIYQKLGAEDRRQAVFLARQVGFLPSQQPSKPAETPARPSGTVTFLFSDIVGSTNLWESQPEAMKRNFHIQESIQRQAIATHGGYTYKMVGDAFQAAFPTAPAALLSALEAQRQLQAIDWGDAPVWVRMALHSAVTEERDDDYVGPELNRIARLIDSGHGGQILLSQPVQSLLGSSLPPGIELIDLGSHHLKDLRRPEHIFQVVAPGIKQTFLPLKTVEIGPRSLRAPSSLFVGREIEIHEARRLLIGPETGARLVSLVGPGGVGKTRLSMQLAAGLIANFSDGVYFVDLSAVESADCCADREQIIFAIANVLQINLPKDGADTVYAHFTFEKLLDYLAERSLLLVLDNFEQITACADLLPELLAAAPGLKLIVTTRERLNIPEEWVLEIEGLPYPPLDSPECQPFSSTQLLEAWAREADLRKTSLSYPAVQFFISCTERLGLGEIPATDWPYVCRICALVLGMPLGIELAAAWLRLFSIQEVTAQVERSLDFLATDQRRLPERHRSLRAVFEHSWELLTNDERRLFSRLAIFQGGFSLAAAGEVVGASPSVLASFLDKSLLRRANHRRFVLHEVLKQFAVEKLQSQPGEWTEMVNRHAIYFAGWIVQIEQKLRSSDQLSALAAMRSESHNVRFAWQNLVAGGYYRLLQQALPGIILFYDMYGPRQEGFTYLSLLLENLRSQPTLPEFPGLLAHALAGTRFFGGYTLLKYSSYQVESLKLVEDLPENLDKAFVLLLASIGAGNLSPESNLANLLESSRIFQALGDAWGQALSAIVLGDLYSMSLNDVPRSVQAYQEGLDYFTRLDNRWGMRLGYFGLGLAAYKSGRLEEAYDLVEKSLAIYESMDNVERAMDVRNTLAHIALALGKRDLARQYIQVNLDSAARLGNLQARDGYQDLLAKTL